MSDTQGMMLSGGLILIIFSVMMVIGGAILIETYNTTLVVTGTVTFPTNFSVDTCGQDLPTEATACGGLATGTITAAGWNGLPLPVNATPNVIGGPDAYDKDWVTNTTFFWNNTPKVLIFNYKVPANTTSAIFQFKFDNATGVPTVSNATISGGTGCRNSTGTYSVMINVTANESFALQCINNSGDYAIIGWIAMPNESFQFFEQQIWWGINKSHTNSTTATNAFVDNIYTDTGAAFTTLVSLIPILILAFVGGIAILSLTSFLGNKSA